MEKIDRPLAYFSSLSKFNEYAEDEQNKVNGVAFPETIAFIKDENSGNRIYTHGHYFGGTSGEGQLAASDITYTDHIATESIEIGILKVKDTEYSIRVPKSEGIDPGTDPEQFTPYDDQWIHDELDGIQSDITTINDKLDGIHQLTDEEVNSAVKQAFTDWDWFKTYAEEHDLINKTWKYEDYDEELGKYMRSIVNVGDLGGAWSTLTQDISSLLATVTSLSTGGATPEEIAEIVQANLGISIDDIDGLKTAVAKLEAMWAEGSDNEKTLNWMKAGYKAYANENKAFAQVIADAQQAAQDGAITAATSALTTEVNRIDGRIDSAEALLATKISSTDAQGLIKTATSGLYTKAEADAAHAGIYAAINNGEESFYAAVKSSVNDYINEDGNKIKQAISQMVAESEAGEEERFASVFVKSDNLGNAVAGLVANNNDVKASITAIVDDKVSNIKIAADKIEFSNGETVAAKILDNITSIAALQADKANLNYVNAQIADVKSLIGDTTSMDSLHSYEGDGTLTGDWSSDIALDGQHVVIDDGLIEGYSKDGDTTTKQYSLKNDGSGSIANGNIRWDKDGNVTGNFTSISKGGVNSINITAMGGCYDDRRNYDENGTYIDGNVYVNEIFSYQIMKNGIICKNGTIVTAWTLTINSDGTFPIGNNYNLFRLKYIDANSPFSSGLVDVNTQDVKDFIAPILQNDGMRKNMFLDDSTKEWLFKDGDVIRFTFPATMTYVSGDNRNIAYFLNPSTAYANELDGNPYFSISWLNLIN